MEETFSAGIQEVQLIFPGLNDKNRDKYQDKLFPAIWEMLNKHFPEDVEAMRGKKFQFILK